jgi:hypothetical protein
MQSIKPLSHITLYIRRNSRSPALRGDGGPQGKKERGWGEKLTSHFHGK